MVPLLQVRQVSLEDLGESELRAEAARLTVSFVERLVRELENGINGFNRPGEILLGAFKLRQLIGVGGLNQEPYDPAPCRARVRHVYVLQDARNQGVATQLIGNLLDHARATFTEVCLRTTNVGAASLYESIGFHRTTSKNATHVLRLDRQ